MVKTGAAWVVTRPTASTCCNRQHVGTSVCRLIPMHPVLSPSTMTTVIGPSHTHWRPHMSKGNRDQRGRPRSTKHCPEAKNGGCDYCVTGDCKRAARRKDRHDARNDERAS